MTNTEMEKGIRSEIPRSTMKTNRGKIGLRAASDRVETKKVRADLGMMATQNHNLIKSIAAVRRGRDMKMKIDVNEAAVRDGGSKFV